jgi:hypothetical protein
MHAGHFHGQDDTQPHIISPAVHRPQLAQSLHGHIGCMRPNISICVLNRPQPDEGISKSCALCGHGPPQLPGGCQCHQCCRLLGGPAGTALQGCCRSSALAAYRPSTARSALRPNNYPVRTSYTIPCMLLKEAHQIMLALPYLGRPRWLPHTCPVATAIS